MKLDHVAVGIAHEDRHTVPPELDGALALALEPTLAGLAERGWLARDGSRWRPTPAGFLFADAVARAVLEATLDVPM